MSYEIKVGKEAEEQATAEKKDYSKLLVKFKDGSAYRVKIPNATSFAQYFAHGVFGKFYTTVHVPDDLYCKASKYYYDLSEKESDEKKKEALKNKGYELSKKERYLFLFIDLDTGSDIIIDVTKKQAQGLIKTIKKNEGKVDKFAFDLTKSGSGQATDVSLDIIVDMDDLLPKQKENFDKAIGKEIDLSSFGKLFVERTNEEQIEDLKKYGIDASFFGDKSNEKEPTPEQQVEEQFDF